MNDVQREDMGRMIDPYLIRDKDEPGKWWCFYKQNGVSYSWSHDLENWTFKVKKIQLKHLQQTVPLASHGVMIC